MNGVGLPRQGISSAMSIVLALTMIGSDAGAMAYQSQNAPPTTSEGSSGKYAGQGTPETADELQSLVAPVALYPDALVAQILNAATFPDQVAVAQYWLESNKSLTGSALAKAADKQSWDPSVKALTQFPSVLDNMAKSLSWTSQLGEAYHNQQAEVMSAIQALRAKAKEAGNLKSGSQITVVQQSPQTIVIQPTNPQVIYVPQYNPTVIYGTPYTTPGYTTGDLVATSVLSFGVGMAVGAAMSGGCCGWGYSSWSCNWYGGAAYYHGAPYYGNAAWHGGYYGGYGNSGYHPYNNGYNNGGYRSNVNNSGYNRTGQNNYTHNTNISGNTVNVNSQGAESRSDGASSLDQHASSGGWGSSDAARGWGSRSDSGASSAFSGWGHNSGSSFGGGGWGSRASSSRGWASRGGGGGWGGGGGGRGGFRR